MLLQTNSYIVPKDRRGDHTRLLRRFRQTLLRLGCDHFDCYEQVGQNWTNGESTGRFVQIMRFRDRKHQLSVQNAERSDPVAQQVISEFCELINFPYQQQQGLFAVGFYTSVLPVLPLRLPGTSPAGMPVNELSLEGGVEVDPQGELIDMEDEIAIPASALDGNASTTRDPNDDEAFS